MINVLRDAFGVDENSVCLIETNSACIQVYDCYDCIPAQQRSYIKTRVEEPVHFTLHNPNTINLCFAALDNCLLNPRDPARCDFIIGNARKLYFVEIKNTITNQKRAARKSAIIQLDAAIENVKNKTDLTDMVLIAVTCLKGKQALPLQNATRVAEIVKFKDRHNAILMEGHTDTF